MEDKTQTPIVESTQDIVVEIDFEPVMQCAVNMIEPFSKAKNVILVAKGDAIPNAVAVANILTEHMLKDSIHVKNITVDSDAPPGIGRMTSTIKIILAKN